MFGFALNVTGVNTAYSAAVIYHLKIFHNNININVEMWKCIL